MQRQPSSTVLAVRRKRESENQSDMEGKQYSLRSREKKQTRLDFPCRRSGRSSVKRRQTGGPVDENAAASPPKRSRLAGGKAAAVSTLTHPLTPLTPTKSPLKEANQIHQPGHVTTTPQSQDCHVTSSPGTPVTGLVFKTPTSQRARKRLAFSPSDSGGGNSSAEHVLTPLQKTKRSLHNSLPSSLLCREDQLSMVRGWVGERVREGRGGALYISGAPGTGKTACVTHLLGEMKPALSGVTVLSVNCMSVTTPQALYSRLATQLHVEAARGRVGRGKESTRDRLMTHVTSSKKLILLVLDELDQLDCRNQEVLYSLFEWSALPRSRLILIGIANALDLTDRILPRLTSHARCKPRLLHFPPYTREEIAAILNARVGAGREGGGEVVMDRAAIEFCARKVSSVHGDLRKALDICRRAIELVESQSHPSTPSHPHKSPRHPLTPSHPHQDKPLCVKLPHIATVISSVYASNTVTLSHSTEHTLPLQQKLAIATLLLCVRGKTVKEVTLGKLQDMYCRVCCRWQLRQEGQTEFVGVCQVLEARGLLSVKKAKETRLTKVTLKLQESEVERVLQDQPLLSSVLQQHI